jgi:cytochrome c oxidase subunit II
MPPSSPFSPYSPQALAISNLFTIDLIIAAFIFALIVGLVIVILVRFRARPGSGEPPQSAGLTKLEIAWTAGPALIVVVLFVLTFITMNRVSAAPAATAQQPDVIVIGHQWWWEYRYPKLNIVTANELHIPAGQRLLVQIQSADVIHSFWIPNLNRKMDATPGYNGAFMYLQADQPGYYQGNCAEYCGNEHAWMLVRVYAQSQADFEAWVRGQQAVPAAPSGGQAAQGAALFEQLSCASCHAIAGTQAKARVGPDLTHVSTRQTLATGIVSNTPANLRAWIKDPQAIKPANNMPSLRLSDTQLDALVAYLESLK